MSLRTQSGFTLAESLVAAALLAITLGGVFYALAAFGRHVAWQIAPQRRAAAILARQTLHVAEDAWKYGTPGNAPSGTQGGVSTTIALDGDSATISVTVRYTPEPGARGDSGIVAVSGQVEQRSPLPGSTIERPGLVPLPSAAP